MSGSPQDGQLAPLLNMDTTWLLPIPDLPPHPLAHGLGPPNPVGARGPLAFRRGSEVSTPSLRHPEAGPGTRLPGFQSQLCCFPVFPRPPRFLPPPLKNRVTARPLPRVTYKVPTTRQRLVREDPQHMPPIGVMLIVRGDVSNVTGREEKALSASTDIKICPRFGCVGSWVHSYG